MPTIPLYYTVIDNAGNIVLSQITTNSNYPVGEGQRLVSDQMPDYNSLTEYVIRIEPVPEDQNYIEYQIADIMYTDEELIDRAISSRNRQLSESDWTQLPDVPLSTAKLDAWKVYRQALRDITDQPGYPGTIIWPTILE